VTPTEGFTVLSLLNADSPDQLQPQTVPHALHEDQNPPDSLPQDVSNPFVYQQPPNAPVLWPLENEREAMLLQHYIDNVALFVRYMTTSHVPDS
jgi:hypothetical protein